jgi:hypothetical protein
MAAPPPLPGHLSNDEVEQLLEPLANFAFAIRDMTSLIQVWQMDEREIYEGKLKTFTLGRSAGSGATLVTGNTSVEVGMFSRPQMRLSHLRIRRRSILHRLGALFSQEKTVGDHGLKAFDSEWLATSRESGAALHLLRRVSRTWMNVASNSILEAEFSGQHIAVHASGGSVSHDVLREAVVLLADACSG